MQSDLLKKMFDNPPPKIGLPEAKAMPRRHLSRIPCGYEDMKKHLEKYVALVKELGADDARVVNVRDIPQDPRILMKCSSPKCPGYGTSGSCPPYYTGDFQKAKEYLGAYTWALVYRVDIPDEGRKYLFGPESLKTFPSKEGRHRLGSVKRYCYGMGDTVESVAFYDGHYFAANCHFGPCLLTFCEEFGKCQEIKTGFCRFPTLARPSVEQTFSIDFNKLANQLGWEHYMLNFCGYPMDCPSDSNYFQMGLTLID
jgi:predicted metal-binding protein